MDSIVTSVIEQFKTRSEFGEKKYGVNMDRDDLSFKGWVTHMKEELMDAILFLTKHTQHPTSALLGGTILST